MAKRRPDIVVVVVALHAHTFIAFKYMHQRCKLRCSRRVTVVDLSLAADRARVLPGWNLCAPRRVCAAMRKPLYLRALHAAAAAAAAY